MSKSSSHGGQNNSQGSGDSKAAPDNRANQPHPNHAATKPAASSGGIDAEDLAEDFGAPSND
jgi:hypothetical protein